MRRVAVFCVPTVLLVALAVLGAAPAVACGGLVGENGTIRLTRTATLAAYHDGVERYVTSFQFTGQGEEVGSIIPLPGVPSRVERGGDWTLQRLQREVQPPRRKFELTAASTAGNSDASVLLETKIDALDITILRGGADGVGRWALDHGFLLTPDAPSVLDHYAHQSKVFMAARFDASRARALGQNAGDGTPIMLTIPVDAPWVPLRILSLGQRRAEPVLADVFLLTDDPPVMEADARDLIIKRNEPASAALLDDLRSDKGMHWMPSKMWFTHLEVQSTARGLRGDLAVAPDSFVASSLTPFGLAPSVATFA